MMHRILQFVLVLFLLSGMSNSVVAQKQIRKTTIGKKEYFVYPYRLENANYLDNLPPYLGELPDGDYVMYYDYYYELRFNLFKFRKVEQPSDSNKVAAFFHMEDRKKEGEWRSFNMKGKKIYTGTFKNDQKEGEWKVYNKYAGTELLDRVENYKNGKKDGPYLSYSSKGKIAAQGNYIDGEKTGEWFQYYPDGKMQVRYFPGQKPETTPSSTFYSQYIVSLNDYGDELGPNYRKATRVFETLKSNGATGPATIYHANGKRFGSFVFKEGYAVQADTVFSEKGLPAVFTFPVEDPYGEGKKIIAVNATDPKGKMRVKYYDNDRIIFRYTLSPLKDTLSFERLYNFGKKLKADSLRLEKISGYDDVTMYTYYHPASSTRLYRKIRKDGKVLEDFRDFRYDPKTLEVTFVESKPRGKDFRVEKFIERNKPALFSSIPETDFFLSSSVCKLFYKDVPYTGKAEIRRVRNYNKHNDLEFDAEKNTLVLYRYYYHKDTRFEMTFKEGFLDGEYREYSQGYCRQKLHFRKGKYHGSQELYSVYNIDKYNRQEVFDNCGKTGKNYVGISHFYQYDNGVLNGNQFQFDRYGNITAFAQFKNGVMDGTYEIYHSSGMIEFLATFKNNVLDGNYQHRTFSYEYHRNRKSRRKYTYEYIWSVKRTIKASFKNGQLDGKFEFYSGESLDFSGEAKDGIKTGNWIEYRENPGSDLIPRYCYSYRMQDSCRFFEILPFTGMENKIYNYRKKNEGTTFFPRDIQKMNCRFSAFYPNKDTCITGFYKGGDQSGAWHFYEEGGRLTATVEFGDKAFLNPTTVGPVEDLLENPMPKITTYHVNGKKHLEGKVIRFIKVYDCVSRLDVPRYFYLYENVWDKDGNQVVKNGTGRVTEYNEQGIKIAEGAVVNFKPEGTWKYYNEEGALSEIGNFVDGLQDGKWLKGDLSGLNLDGLNCFDANDPNIQKMMEVMKKKISLSEYNYNHGVLLSSYHYNIDMNKEVRSRYKTSKHNQGVHF